MESVREMLFRGSRSVPSYSPEEAQRLTAQMRVEAYNSCTGSLSGYDCKKCMNRGSLALLNEAGNGILMRDCSCMKIRRCVWKMESSGLSDIIRKYTFDSFRCNTDWQEKLRSTAETFAKKADSWFLLCGQSGAGKTHLCTAICRQLLLDGREVVYMPWREDITTLKGLSLDSEEREKQLQRIKTAEVLYIDDLFKNGRDKDGSSMPTRADVELAFEIMNYRYNSRLVTILSTERSPQELLEIDQALGSRITERSEEYVLFVGPDSSRNYRLRSIVSL